MEMNTIEELKERVILIGVSVSDGDDTEESLKELKELADTAGAEKRSDPPGHLHWKRKNRGSPGDGFRA